MLTNLYTKVTFSNPRCPDRDKICPLKKPMTGTCSHRRSKLGTWMLIKFDPIIIIIVMMIIIPFGEVVLVGLD